MCCCTKDGFYFLDIKRRYGEIILNYYLEHEQVSPYLYSV